MAEDTVQPTMELAVAAMGAQLARRTHSGRRR
jgi:hypothetical protein